MIYVPYDKLTAEQQDAWSEIQAKLAELHAETGDGNGWMFHGTDHLSSTYILEHGFRYHIDPSEDPRRTWVYFGQFQLAVSFAEKRMDADSPPVILAVKTSDLIAAGIEVDPNYDDNPPVGWRDYVRQGGSVRIPGGAVLPSMIRYDLGHLPLHPNAIEQRDERKGKNSRYYGRCLPHPLEMANVAEVVIAEDIVPTMAAFG